MKRRRGLGWLALFGLVLVLPSTSAQETRGRLDLGMNLAGVSDYGAEYPAIDLMTATRGWFTHNAGWIDGGKNAWDTEKAQLVKYGSDGLPVSELPIRLEGTEGPQVLSTLWANAKALGPGPFVLTWSGEAEVVPDMGAQNLQRSPGRVVFDLKGEDLLRITVTKNNPARPLKNLRLVNQRFEAETGRWNPVWLAKLKPFTTLRFMDWGATNGSPLVQWSDRAKPEFFRWTTAAGVPYESMIDLCNTLGVNGWINVPHLASPEFIAEMARLFKAGLKPGLKLYVEYSNETWNWMFAQTNWLNQTGNQGQTWPERIVPFHQRAFDLWTKEWKDRESDLVRVVGVQTAWLDVATRVAKNLRPGSFDAVAGGFYLGLSEESTKELARLGSKAAGADVLRLAAADMERIHKADLAALDRLAGQLGVRLVLYEGGQHFTPHPFGSVQPYNQALVDANRGEGIYRLYLAWFDYLKTLRSAKIGRGLTALHFNLASPPSGQYGSWGALESVWDQPPYLKSAPKYQALIDSMNP